MQTSTCTSCSQAFDAIRLQSPPLPSPPHILKAAIYTACCTLLSQNILQLPRPRLSLVMHPLSTRPAC